MYHHWSLTTHPLSFIIAYNIQHVHNESWLRNLRTVPRKHTSFLFGNFFKQPVTIVDAIGDISNNCNTNEVPKQRFIMNLHVGDIMVYTDWPLCGNPDININDLFDTSNSPDIRWTNRDRIKTENITRVGLGFKIYYVCTVSTDSTDTTSAEKSVTE
jgi:hypothetical protein